MQARVITTHKPPVIKSHKPPLFLVFMATLTAVAIALPLTYLVICTAGVAGEQLWDLVSRPRTLAVLFNSAGIAIAAHYFQP
jgi:iron(III) transport system permease protein